MNPIGSGSNGNFPPNSHSELDSRLGWKQGAAELLRRLNVDNSYVISGIMHRFVRNHEPSLESGISYDELEALTEACIDIAFSNLVRLDFVLADYDPEEDEFGDITVLLALARQFHLEVLNEGVKQYGTRYLNKYKNDVIKIRNRLRESVAATRRKRLDLMQIEQIRQLSLSRIGIDGQFLVKDPGDLAYFDPRQGDAVLMHIMLYAADVRDADTSVVDQLDLNARDITIPPSCELDMRCFAVFKAVMDQCQHAESIDISQHAIGDAALPVLRQLAVEAPHLKKLRVTLVDADFQELALLHQHCKNHDVELEFGFD